MSPFEIAAIALAVLASALALALMRRVRILSDKLSAIPEDGNLYEAIRRLDADLSSAEEAIGRLQPVVRSLAKRMPTAVRYSAVVAYDAHQDLAGRLSRSIALLDERGNGLVITLMVGRSDSMFYTKMVRDGTGSEPLSPEEETAIRRALGR